MTPKKKTRVNWHEIRVGLFTVACLVILIFMLFRVSGGRGFFSAKIIAVTYLPAVQGMKPGAPVWLNGIEVGNVEAIVMEPKLPPTRVNKELETTLARLKRDIGVNEKDLVSSRRRLESMKKAEGSGTLEEQIKLRDEIRREEEYLANLQKTANKLAQELKTSRSDLQSIRLVLQIEKEYIEWIRQDSEVSIGSIGLLGDSYVNISIGRLPEPPSRTADGAILIDGISETSLRQLMIGAGDLMGTFAEISDRVKSITSKVDKGEGTIGQLVNNSALHDSLVTVTRNLDTTVKQASAVMTDIHDSRGTLGMLIKSDTLYKELTGTLTELKSFTHMLNQSQGTVQKLIQDPALFDNLKSVTGRLDKVMAGVQQGQGTLGKLVTDEGFFTEAKGALQKLHAILAVIESGEGALGQIVKNKELYDNLNASLSELLKFIYDLRKNPKKYLQIKFQLF